MIIEHGLPKKGGARSWGGEERSEYLQYMFVRLLQIL